MGGIRTYFTVCLITIHYLTLFVVYNYMMPWPLHCKISEEPIHPKRNFTKYPFKIKACCRPLYIGHCDLDTSVYIGHGDLDTSVYIGHCDLDTSVYIGHGDLDTSVYIGHCDLDTSPGAL